MISNDYYQRYLILLCTYTRNKLHTKFIRYITDIIVSNGTCIPSAKQPVHPHPQPNTHILRHTNTICTHTHTPTTTNLYIYLHMKKNQNYDCIKIYIIISFILLKVKKFCFRLFFIQFVSLRLCSSAQQDLDLCLHFCRYLQLLEQNFC